MFFISLEFCIFSVSLRHFVSTFQHFQHVSFVESLFVFLNKSVLTIISNAKFFLLVIRMRFCFAICVESLIY